MKRTRMLGHGQELQRFQRSEGRSGLRAGAGGVRGRVKQKAARANEAMPATRNVLVKAASMAGPVLGVPSALPSQEMKPAGLLPSLGTLAQSIGMKMNGQLAAIQPIVPQTRMQAEVLLGVLDIGERDRVGHRHRRHIEETVQEHEEEHRPERLGSRSRPSIAMPPIRWLTARNLDCSK